ncbi:hypothetical protein Tco_0871100 [Tanacetum coccineum]
MDYDGSSPSRLVLPPKVEYDIMQFMDQFEMLICKRALHERDLWIKEREGMIHMLDAEVAHFNEVVWDTNDVVVGPSVDTDILARVQHSSVDDYDNVVGFDNVLIHEIQNHKQPESIYDTCGK